MVHFFDPSSFWVPTTSLSLKLHEKPIQPGFWAQKRRFWAFRNFFLENHGFSVQNGNFFFINTFCPEMSRNLFQTWFAVIFIIPAHQNGQNGIFDHFRPFLVIFSGYPKIANLGGCVSPKWTFLAWIRFFRSKTIFDMLWVSRNLLVKTQSKNGIFFLGISTMEFLHIFALICPFIGLFEWFRAKTTWETHPTGFLSQKKGILCFSEFFSKKSMKIFLIIQNFSESFLKHQNLFFLCSEI